MRGETSRVFASVVSGANRSEGRDRASVKCLGFCPILIARTAGRLQFRLRRGSQSSLHDDCFDESFVQIFTSSTAIDRVAETPACNILTATTDFRRHLPERHDDKTKHCPWIANHPPGWPVDTNLPERHIGDIQIFHLLCFSDKAPS